MKTFIQVLIILFCFFSCGSSKRASERKTVSTKTERSTSSIKPNAKTTAIINTAEDFKGVRYKYGGTTKRGMDCSGLLYVAFREHGVSIPRVSSDMAKQGDWIDIKAIKPGDLVFFATKKNSRRINHVGLVTNVRGDDIQFIHSTTSKGVITSSIKERYWYLAYVQARRLL
ncbi:C40 family peptidase [Ichthyenterobacterium sp. W332]|uniref:C40 family peptidase n=1 Tax=Microcosmobacter mediterraneus TaxID=3075607 RepID=A0ABU2YJZ9_9FLAO|nr:C40 family peptidase [Ichthyenterobacterium sp. W332]MDT0558483.1 C40 family peptidase [Ichthyenterobacterium sp. W332]